MESLVRVGIGAVRGILGDSVDVDSIEKALWASRGDVGTALNILLDTEATRRLQGSQPHGPAALSDERLDKQGGEDTDSAPLTTRVQIQSHTAHAMAHDVVTPTPPVACSPPEAEARLDSFASEELCSEKSQVPVLIGSSCRPSAIDSCAEDGAAPLAPGTEVSGKGAPLSWPRQLGVSHVQGLCLTRLRAGEIAAGEELLLKRDTASGNAKSRGKGRGGDGRASGGRSGSRGKGLLKQGSFSSTAISAGKRNTIIRFCSKSGGELGRLPSEIADSLAPLLDERKVVAQIQSACAVPPCGLGIMDAFPLMVTIYLDKSAFSMEQSAASVSDGSADATISARRFALSRLLGAMRIKPDLPAKKDLYIPSSSAKLECESDPSAKAWLGCVGAPPSTGGDTAEPGALSEEQVDSVYHKLGCDTRELEKFERAQPRALTSTLHNYQRQGMGWMLWRELSEGQRLHRASTSASKHNTQVAPSSEAGDESLHPAWTRYCFAERAGAGPSYFYVNHSTGAASVERPSEETEPRGGILADEMGLGKTIMMIALILADAETPEKGGEQEASGPLDLPRVSNLQQDSEYCSSPRRADDDGKGPAAGEGHLSSDELAIDVALASIGQSTSIQEREATEEPALQSFSDVPGQLTEAAVGKGVAGGEAYVSSDELAVDVGRVATKRSTLSPARPIARDASEREPAILSGSDVARAHVIMSGGLDCEPVGGQSVMFEWTDQTKPASSSLADPSREHKRQGTPDVSMRCVSEGSAIEEPPIATPEQGTSSEAIRSALADELPELVLETAFSVGTPCDMAKGRSGEAADSSSRESEAQSITQTCLALNRARRRCSQGVSYLRQVNIDAKKEQPAALKAHKQQRVKVDASQSHEALDMENMPGGKKMRRKPQQVPCASKRGRVIDIADSDADMSAESAHDSCTDQSAALSESDSESNSVIDVASDSDAMGESPLRPRKRRATAKSQGVSDSNTVGAGPRATNAKMAHSGNEKKAAVQMRRGRFVSGRSSTLQRGGKTLVVCPTSLLSQWDEQLHLHVRNGELSIMVYYGGTRAKEAAAFSSYDVVLTTYGVISSDYGKFSPADATASDLDQSGDSVAARLQKADGMQLSVDTLLASGRPPPFCVKWRRIVLDEAHYIKGRASLTARAVCALQAERRWALTGTPIQNHLDDLFGLLHFLRASPFDEYTHWKKAILRPLMEEKNVRALHLLHQTLQPLLLRRTKDSRLSDGSRILQLPHRKVVIERLIFSAEEKDFYDALRTHSKVRFDTFVAEGRVLNNYAHVLAMLQQMRQACDHPFLVLSRSDANTDVGRIGAILLRRWQAQASKDSDLDSKQVFLASKLDEVQRLANLSGSSEGGAANDAAICSICLETFEDPVLTSCAHTFCRECIVSCLGPSLGAAPCPVCREVVRRTDLITIPRASRLIETQRAPAPGGSRAEWHATVFSNDRISPNTGFSVDLDAAWRPSSKLNALMDDLRSTLATPLPPPSFAIPAGMTAAKVAKCVVISQWTAMLDLVEKPLRAENINFGRLDGSMSQSARSHTLSNFSSDPKLRVLLLSLHAGGVGLNLVSAQTVYLLDPWWNPAVEEQAINRIHRIGQAHPVRVKHFVVQNTVEDRILELQKKKSALVKGALGGNDEESKQMRIEDLRALFS